MGRLAMRYLSLLLVLLCSVVLAEPLQVIYPRDAGRDKENSYDYQLLQLALEKSGIEYHLSLSSLEMNESRARVMISHNSPSVTVMSSGTSIAFESELQAVYIPLFGGLIGYRLFIVHQDNRNLFANVSNLQDLQQFTAGMGRDWADVEVFEQAALPVATNEYPMLFKLVEGKRIDYFPRGANEPFAELERFLPEYPSLAIDQHVVLVYPYALYYFVSKNNQALHDAIEKGLKAAHSDGSFLAFFNNHPATQKMLTNARLGERVRIDINNPNMTAETLAIPARYWYGESWYTQ